jgi:hypothetical protein
MIYVLALILSVLVFLNLYASWRVLRDGLSTTTQKLMQLGFIWLLPIIGPVLTVSLISGTRHPTMDFASGREMGFESYWHASLGSGDSPTDQSCASDCSCD